MSEELEPLTPSDGASAEQINVAWNSNPTLRSVQGQRLLFEAARSRLARKGIREKVVRPPPPVVQAPGSGALERPSAQTAAVMEASRRLDKTASAKDAAKLLIAMRNARR